MSQQAASSRFSDLGLACTEAASALRFLGEAFDGAQCVLRLHRAGMSQNSPSTYPADHGRSTPDSRQPGTLTNANVVGLDGADIAAGQQPP